MTKLRLVPLLFFCFLLVSCSGSPAKLEETESTNVTDLGEGYFLEATDLVQENGDSIYYLWHKDRENLRSAFPVSADSELIHEIENDTLYFLNCPEAQYKIGLSYETDAIHYLDFETTSETYDEVLTLYEEALTASGWFEIQVLSGNETDKDSGYVKVEHDTYKTYDAFEKHLNTLFSEEVVQSLLSRDLYKNIDGALYAAPSLGRGTNDFIVKWHYGVKKVSENQIVFSVYLEKMTEAFYSSHDGHYPYKDPVDVEQIEIKTYTLEKFDGEWKFINFEYPI